MKHSKRQPLQPYTFPCGHSGIFPERGKANKFAEWAADGWVCRPCKAKATVKRNQGKGKLGLISWARRKLAEGRQKARRGNYSPAIITAENLVKLREQTSVCCFTGRKISFKRKPVPHLEHDHKTGIVRGFAHPNANLAEGFLKKFSTAEIVQFIRKAFPAVAETLLKSGHRTQKKENTV